MRTRPVLRRSLSSSGPKSSTKTRASRGPSRRPFSRSASSVAILKPLVTSANKNSLITSAFNTNAVTVPSVIKYDGLSCRVFLPNHEARPPEPFYIYWP